MIPEINNATEMTFEITLKGEKYDCVLRSFFLNGEDLELRTNIFLDEALTSASDETILTKLWEENIGILTMTFASDSKKAETEDQREFFAALSKALENLDYTKIKKDLIR